MPTAPSAPREPGIDFGDPGLPRILHAAVAALREADPVHRIGDGRWLVTRYADVAPLLKDRTRLSTDIHAARGYDEARPFGAGTALETFMEGLLISLHGAEHRRVRGAFTPPFTRAGVERSMVALIDGICDDLFAALPVDGEIDLLAELARPLPARVFAALFGLPEQDLDRLMELFHADTAGLDVLLSPDGAGAEKLAHGQAAMLALRVYLDELATIRRAQPGDDLMSFLLAAHDAGTLTYDDVLTQAGEALAAGTNTTMTLVAGMFEAFAAFPDEWDRVRADPALIAPAVEEALRWVSPALATGRMVVEPFAVGGREVAVGDVLQLCLLAADRDPEVFDDPDRFDVGRFADGAGAAPHVAFGGGVHVCLGQHVARLEARVVLARAAQRWSRIAIDPAAIELHPMVAVRTYAALPARLSA
jgi:cytochrome P450